MLRFKQVLVLCPLIIMHFNSINTQILEHSFTSKESSFLSKRRIIEDSVGTSCSDGGSFGFSPYMDSTSARIMCFCFTQAAPEEPHFLFTDSDPKDSNSSCHHSFLKFDVFIILFIFILHGVLFHLSLLSLGSRTQQIPFEFINGNFSSAEMRPLCNTEQASSSESGQKKKHFVHFRRGI